MMSPLETVPENCAINISDYSDESKDNCFVETKCKLGTTPTTVIMTKPLEKRFADILLSSLLPPFQSRRMATMRRKQRMKR